MASSPVVAAPYWAAQLDFPPIAKSKVPGIIDPPGFSSAPSGPKVILLFSLLCSPKTRASY